MGTNEQIVYNKAKGKISDLRKYCSYKESYPVYLDAGAVSLYTCKIDRVKDYIEVVFVSDEIHDDNDFWKYSKPTKNEIKMYERYKKAYKLMKR